MAYSMQSIINREAAKNDLDLATFVLKQKNIVLVNPNEKICRLCSSIKNFPILNQTL